MCTLAETVPNIEEPLVAFILLSTQHIEKSSNLDFGTKRIIHYTSINSVL
jgi:hypothetical protein